MRRRSHSVVNAVFPKDFVRLNECAWTQIGKSAGRKVTNQPQETLLNQRGLVRTGREFCRINFGIPGVLCYTEIVRFSLSRGVRINLTRCNESGLFGSRDEDDILAFVPDVLRQAILRALVRDVFVSCIDVRFVSDLVG